MPTNNDLEYRQTTALEKFRFAAGHVSADGHTHIHRELGELWSVAPGEISMADGDVLDIVVENPADSGNVLEVLSWSVGANSDSQVTQYRDDGIYTGNETAITAQNFDDTVTGAANFNAEYATGADPQLVDTSADTQFNGGFYTGSSQADKATATVAARPELDVTVGEGRSFAVHLKALSAVDPIPGLIVAEYGVDREI